MSVFFKTLLEALVTFKKHFIKTFQNTGVEIVRSDINIHRFENLFLLKIQFLNTESLINRKLLQFLF